ncbi:MAG: mechanosensitive ion channel domain-containing protein [Nanoarchaeota archaeon]
MPEEIDQKQLRLIRTAFSLSISGIIVLSVWAGCRGGKCLTAFSHWEPFFGTALDFLPKAVFLIVLYFIFRIPSHYGIEVVLKKLFQDKEDSFSATSKFLKFALWTIYALIALNILFDNIGSIVTSLGLIGFGLTFALQKPILNFVGWLTIIFKGLYKEGDRIKVGTARGDVRSIQTMNTILEGLLETSDLPSGKILIIPNELVLTGEVENYTKETNYIREELHITITYESNYHKAMKILRDIVVEQIRKNRNTYKRRLVRKEREMNLFLNKIITEPSPDKRADVNLQKEADKLQKEKQQAEQAVAELEEEFKPRIRIDLLDSAIQLIAQFPTPYDQIKKNKTDIYLAFMDTIRNEADIEIAYPHLQIIYPDHIKKRRGQKDIMQFGPKA